MLLELAENSEATSVEEEPIHLYCTGCFMETGLKIAFCGKDETNEPDTDCGPEDECAMCVWEQESYERDEWGFPVCSRGHELRWD